VGTGRIPVEIAAERGQRFPGAQDTVPAEPFLVQTAVVTLGPREAQEIELRCNFKPQQIVVDPEVQVLQRGRASSIHHF